MKPLRLSMLLTLGFLVFHSCEKDKLPFVDTMPVSRIERHSARSGGMVMYYGNDDILSRGLCWGQFENPTISYPRSEQYGDTGIFKGMMTELLADTKYYVRAYATTEEGIAYGNQQSFTTLPFDPLLFNPGVTYGTLLDVEGNAYKTVQTGTQTWMAQNLRTTLLNDGTPIRHEMDNFQWTFSTKPCYCRYDHGGNNYAEVYGALYNWYAVESDKLCPAGWHVPDDSDWETLIADQGGAAVAGEKLKESGNTHWDYQFEEAAGNESGFTAVPEGYRGNSGRFWAMGISCSWWSADTSENGGGSRWILYSHYEETSMEGLGIGKNHGYAVRCVKD